MQLLPVLLVAVAFVSRCDASDDTLVSIASGTSFGRCVGLCRQSVTLMTNPLKVITSREANYNQASYPPVHVQSPLNFSEWFDLASLVDLDAFRQLDERIGCPDCADGGAEWIQVTWQNGGKRVTFENGQTIAGMEKLVTALRQLRNVYLSQV